MDPKYDKTKLYPLKGFIVGNGATDWNYDADISYAEVFVNFNVIPLDLYQQYQQNKCQFYWGDVIKHENPEACGLIWEQILDLTSDLNIYDLYRKTYPQDAMKKKALHANRMGSVMVEGMEKTYTIGYTAKEYFSWHKVLRNTRDEDHEINGSFLSNYINSPEVRKALNIPAEIGGWD